MKDVLLSRLDKVKSVGRNKYKACCPAHDDSDPSMSILFNDDGRILIHCFAGCDVLDIVHSVGLTMNDLFPDGAIRDFMASAAQKTIKKTTRDDYMLLICDESRNRGERLTAADLKAERGAYLRSRKI